ncbi:DUF7319 domain-containing protein [Halobellus captivus]|uniref:DUF7319 domain-containing protein n=1 Tax=Halobellus captivus TaxID=2592614 RepID=UPI001EF0934B|nr:hypothetical protein [Halobellus captivus]
MTESSEESDATEGRSDPRAPDGSMDEASASTTGDGGGSSTAGDEDGSSTTGDEDGSPTAGDAQSASKSPSESADLDALRRQVEKTYDFDDFGPQEMAEMSLDEWEAVFDPDTWIVGEELLDRVEQELNARVAIREIFAVVERVRAGDDRVVAYSDEGYAIVHADGSVEGEGTVLRDVKPTVALCSMESYELMDAPEDASLPDPDEIVEGSGEFGNLMLQIVAAAQMVVGLGLLVAWIALPSLSTIVAPIAAIGFLVIGFFLFLVVANARLSDRFRTREFRNRLRALEAVKDERPEFLPDRPTAGRAEEEGGPSTEAEAIDGGDASDPAETADDGTDSERPL